MNLPETALPGANVLVEDRQVGQPMPIPLSANVELLIDTVLQEAPIGPNGQRKTTEAFFDHPVRGEVYRSYMFSQFLEDPLERPKLIPWLRRGEQMANLYELYKLTGDGSENWVQLYEHICGVTAAAETIASRFQQAGVLTEDQVGYAKHAAVLHDATKRRDVEKHGSLANSLLNGYKTFPGAIELAFFPDVIITAAMNTGRQDRILATAEERRASIESKGVVAAIVGLADARSLGADFRPLEEAQAHYLSRKKDPESQDFFINHWLPYYRDVERYLNGQLPGVLDGLTNETIYNETVLPAVLGPATSEAVYRQYAYSNSQEK